MSEKDDPNMEYITLNLASKEFKVSRATLNWWVRKQKLPAVVRYTELGVKYWEVRRGDLAELLQNRPKRGRPLSRG